MRIKGVSKFSSDIELARHSVVESNGLVVTKQLVLGNLVGKHRLCFRGSWGLIEGGVSSKAKKKSLAALNNMGVCSGFFRENGLM